MNVWPSRGLALVGFEIKASRSDWLRELKKPEKADPLVRLVDQWYVVAPKDVVQDGELPAGWGLLVPRGSKLVASVPPAPANGSREKPLAREFVAAFLRRAAGVVHDRKELRAEYHRGFEAGMTAGGKVEAQEILRLQRELEGEKQAIKDFEEASGLRLWNWQAGRIGDAVKAVLAGEDRVQAAHNQLRMLRQDADRLVRTIDGVLSAAKDRSAAGAS